MKRVFTSLILMSVIMGCYSCNSANTVPAAGIGATQQGAAVKGAYDLMETLDSTDEDAGQATKQAVANEPVDSTRAVIEQRGDRSSVRR